MAATESAQLGFEPLLGNIAGRFGWQYVTERRTEKAHRRAEARPCRLQKRAALADIAHDVFDIALRDHPAPAVAVEDDQIELVELDVEEFTDRKRDQRQFTDRSAVLLLRRPQDREMDEIDRRVRFQDVAPYPLTGMRLAGNQQHAQPV